MCTAAILAGGEGRRLGGALKPLLPLGSQRIIDHQLHALRAVMELVVIVTPAPDPFDGLGAPVWVDARPGSGPLGGIMTVLERAPTEETLIVAGDLPFVTSAFIHHLATRPAGGDVTIPRTAAGYQPLCARYHRACLPAVRRQLDHGRLAVVDLLSRVTVHELGPVDVARFDPDGTLFLNINTPEDYARAQRLAATDSAGTPT